MYKQLILNHEHKVFFCLVEKNGNTNVRMMFLIAAGLVPATTSAENRSQFDEHIRRYHALKDCIRPCKTQQRRDYRIITASIF